MKKIKKAQLGSLLKAGAKTLGKAVKKSATKSVPKIGDDEIIAAMKQHQRNLMKSRFKQLDKEEAINSLKNNGGKGPKGGGLFPTDKKRSGGKVSKKK